MEVLIYGLMVIGLIVGIAWLFIGLSALRAYILNQLWTWFVLPAFGIKSPGMVLLFGICLTVSVLTGEYGHIRSYKNKQTKEEIVPSNQWMSLVSLLMIWGIGAITHFYFQG